MNASVVLLGLLVLPLSETTQRTPYKHEQQNQEPPTRIGRFRKTYRLLLAWTIFVEPHGSSLVASSFTSVRT